MSLEVDLTEPLEAFVREKVSLGDYRSTDAVLEEAVRLLEEHDDCRRADVAAKIEQGMSSARAGRLVSAEEVWSEVDEIIRVEGRSSRNA